MQFALEQEEDRLGVRICIRRGRRVRSGLRLALEESSKWAFWAARCVATEARAWAEANGDMVAWNRAEMFR
jgi:hypothetical protein